MRGRPESAAFCVSFLPGFAMSDLTSSPEWLALSAQAVELLSRRTADLFAGDAARADTFALDAVGLHLDFSKQRVDRATLNDLFALARARQLPQWIERMFAGERINSTENRAVLHTALRYFGDQSITVDGEDVMPAVRREREHVQAFAAEVRGGDWRGATAEKITDVVNIGIGGSDLGPRMVCETLAPLIDGPRAHFVANVDGAQITRVLAGLRPASTLFVVTSKTFTTQETMANARAARNWLTQALGESAVAQHFVAVSTNLKEVERFGIHGHRMFQFWDWVGGRYSLWSAVGLPIAVALGPERYQALLEGAQAMDRHFATAPLERNMPVLLGLLAVWNTNFIGAASQVIAPYAQRLDRFVAWLQQLEMESNGKRISRGGSVLDYASTLPLWGDVGTNSQHAFFQMLHQGSAVHAVDFILPLAPDHHQLPEQHRMLIANCLAQSAALMRGRTAEEVRAELRSAGVDGEALEAAVPHRVFPGNRPSNTLLLPRIDAYNLGALLALYEHRTFVQSVIWDINAFDQWGVELGKKIAGQILPALGGGSAGDFDPSTQRLIDRIRGTGVTDEHNGVWQKHSP